MHWIDPDSLPEISGKFERFLLNPHGDADGLLLLEGVEVHFPPHLGAQLRKAIDDDREGLLRIRGVRPREGDVFAAVLIETAAGVRILDNGPPKKRGDDERPPGAPHESVKRAPTTAAGVVRRPLHGPRGERRGVLLEDGRMVRFPPHEAPHLKELLTCGAALVARGEGLVTPLGTIIEAREIGADAQSLRRLGKDDKPKKKPKHPPH
jgi:hypothetical protein